MGFGNQAFFKTEFWRLVVISLDVFFYKKVPKYYLGTFYINYF